MPSLLLNLRHVPDDEADEIRALLDEHGIAFYETRPSFWGVSAGAIWIRNREDAGSAQRLMADYQRRRATSARAEYEAAKLEGNAKTLWAAVRQDPLRAAVVLAGIAFFVAVLALPFLLLGD